MPHPLDLHAAAIDAVEASKLAGRVERFVLYALAHHWNVETAVAYPSVTALARLVGCHRRTVQRALRTLEETGDVVIVEPARGTRAPRYDLPRLREALRELEKRRPPASATPRSASTPASATPRSASSEPDLTPRSSWSVVAPPESAPSDEPADASGALEAHYGVITPSRGALEAPPGVTRTRTLELEHAALRENENPAPAPDPYRRAPWRRPKGSS